MKRIKDNEINACLDWLGEMKLRKGVNPNHTSYWYKHQVEKQSKLYISEAKFIEAVKLTGYTYQTSGNGKSILVNLSEKNFKKTK